MSDYLSAEEAAQRCRVSSKTVRRWIESGRLKADKAGRSFRIDANDLAPFIGHAADNGQGAAAPADMSAALPQQGAALSADVAAELLHLVDRLQRENLELAGRVGYYQAETEQLRSTLKALQAPGEGPITTETAGAVEPSQEPPARPWWQRLLWGS